MSVGSNNNEFVVRTGKNSIPHGLADDRDASQAGAENKDGLHHNDCIKVEIELNCGEGVQDQAISARIVIDREGK